MLELFDNENIISELSDKTIILTSHRIIKQDNSYNQSIMLEHVTSCENKYTKMEWLLWAARISFIFCIVCLYFFNANFPEFTSSLAILSVIFLIAYYILGINQLIIGSPSTKMVINVKRIKKNDVLHFINQIEKTKNNL